MSHFIYHYFDQLIFALLAILSLRPLRETIFLAKVAKLNPQKTQRKKFHFLSILNFQLLHWPFDPSTGQGSLGTGYFAVKY